MTPVLQSPAAISVELQSNETFYFLTVVTVFFSSSGPG